MSGGSSSPVTGSGPMCLSTSGAEEGIDAITTEEIGWRERKKRRHVLEASQEQEPSEHSRSPIRKEFFNRIGRKRSFGTACQFHPKRKLTDDLMGRRKRWSRSPARVFIYSG